MMKAANEQFGILVQAFCRVNGDDQKKWTAFLIIPKR